MNLAGQEFFLTKILKKNYLLVDNRRNYDPKSKDQYIKIPWYLLFEVDQNGELENVCVLKREK